MKAPVEAGILTPDGYAEWDRFVGENEGGSPYHLSSYLACLARAVGAEFRLLAVRRGCEILGGVPLFEARSGSGTYVTPRLLLYYNGPLVRPSSSKYPSERASRSVGVLRRLEESLRGRGYGRLAFRARSALTDARMFLERGWSVRPTYSYIVDLTDLQTAWSRVEQNLRRLIDRCARAGVSFTEDDDFDSFFALHAQTHERKGADLYLPRPAFATYFSTLHRGGIARMFHARLPDGRSIAAQLVLLGAHPVTHTASAAADGEHLRSGAAAFLRWNVFRWLAEAGKKANDLTDASLNSVTHFKAQLGGDLHTNLWLEAPESWRFRIQRAVRNLRRAARRALRGRRP